MTENADFELVLQNAVLSREGLLSSRVRVSTACVRDAVGPRTWVGEERPWMAGDRYYTEGSAVGV